MTPWDPEVVARIHHLNLVAKRVVDGLMHGAHRSLRLGANVEFADYKEYTPGDPLRSLDWRVYAKRDRLVTKRYEAETEIACTLVVDLSADLSTGEEGKSLLPSLEGSKLGSGICLAACLAAYLHRQGEPVGLALLGGDKEERVYLPPRTNKSHMAQLFRILAEARAGGRADLGQALGELAPRMRRRSLVVLVSDFMEEPDSWIPLLSGFGRRQTDLVGFHLMDRREMSLDYAQPLIFFSPEGGVDLAVDPVAASGEFVEVVEEFRQEVQQGLRAFGGRYYPCWTDEPLEKALRPMIGGRPCA